MQKSIENRKNKIYTILMFPFYEDRIMLQNYDKRKNKKPFLLACKNLEIGSQPFKCRYYFISSLSTKTL